jgi:hypothetical protein
MSKYKVFTNGDVMIMKRVGYFFSSFLPLMIAIGAQFLAIALLMGVAALFLFVFHSNSESLDTFLSLLTNMDFNTCVMVIYSIICIVVFGLWYRHSCGGEYLPNPSRTFTVAQLAGVVILVPGMQFFSSYLVTIVSLAVPKWLEQYETLIETAGLSDDISPLMLCYSILLAPVCEELLFRGVTMRLARKALPFWLANLLQAFLFGFFHMNWIQGIYAFALGLVLGYVCEKGGSIYYSLLFHILFNFWGTVIGELFENVASTAFTALLMFLAMLVSLSVGGTLFAIGTQRKKTRSRIYT